MPPLNELIDYLIKIDSSGITLVMMALSVWAILLLGFKFGSQVTKKIAGSLVSDTDEKPKRELTTYVEEPTEPDYVVGFGDDGELIYASDEKPKRKNDEV